MIKLLLEIKTDIIGLQNNIEAGNPIEDKKASLTSKAQAALEQTKADSNLINITHTGHAFTEVSSRVLQQALERNRHKLTVEVAEEYSSTLSLITAAEGKNQSLDALNKSLQLQQIKTFSLQKIIEETALAASENGPENIKNMQDSIDMLLYFCHTAQSITLCNIAWREKETLFCSYLNQDHFSIDESTAEQVQYYIITAMGYIFGNKNENTFNGLDRKSRLEMMCRLYDEISSQPKDVSRHINDRYHHREDASVSTLLQRALDYLIPLADKDKIELALNYLQYIPYPEKDDKEMFSILCEGYSDILLKKINRENTKDLSEMQFSQLCKHPGNNFLEKIEDPLTLREYQLESLCALNPSFLIEKIKGSKAGGLHPRHVPLENFKLLCNHLGGNYLETIGELGSLSEQQMQTICTSGQEHLLQRLGSENIQKLPATTFELLCKHLGENFLSIIDRPGDLHQQQFRLLCTSHQEFLLQKLNGVDIESLNETQFKIVSTNTDNKLLDKITDIWSLEDSKLSLLLDIKPSYLKTKIETISLKDMRENTFTILLDSGRLTDELVRKAMIGSLADWQLLLLFQKIDIDQLQKLCRRRTKGLQNKGFVFIKQQDSLGDDLARLYQCFYEKNKNVLTRGIAIFAPGSDIYDKLQALIERANRNSRSHAGRFLDIIFPGFYENKEHLLRVNTKSKNIKTSVKLEFIRRYIESDGTLTAKQFSQYMPTAKTANPPPPMLQQDNTVKPGIPCDLPLTGGQLTADTVSASDIGIPVAKILVTRTSGNNDGNVMPGIPCSLAETHGCSISKAGFLQTTGRQQEKPVSSTYNKTTARPKT